MKLNARLDHLRRSPRLNPRPRRSPRIKMLSESESTPDEPEESTISNEREEAKGRETLRSRRPASLGSDTLPPTPSQNATKASKKAKSAVQFGRKTLKVVQSFDGSDPPSRIRRVSCGKRLFASLASGEGKAKRIKIGDEKRNERTVILAKAVAVIVGSLVVAGSVGAFLGKVVIKW